jgi:hypothetical protein
MGDRVPKDAQGRPRRRTTAEVITQSIKDKLGIGSGARGRQIDREVDRITRMRAGQSSDSNN